MKNKPPPKIKTTPVGVFEKSILLVTRNLLFVRLNFKMIIITNYLREGLLQ